MLSQLPDSLVAAAAADSAKRALLDAPALDGKYVGIAIFMFFAGVGLLKWAMRAYRQTYEVAPVGGLRRRTASPRARLLHEMGIATAEQLEAMPASERERLFAEAMTRGAGRAPMTAAERLRVRCSPDYLFCPGCGATLGDRRTPIGYLTSCLTCKRPLAARQDGDRILIEST
jgi:hypothetical protein